MTKSIDVDEDLIKQAKKETRKKTEKGAIEKAVREYLRIERIRKDIASLKGTVSFK